MNSKFSKIINKNNLYIYSNINPNKYIIKIM